MAKISLKRALTDPKYRDTLTDLQLYQVHQHIKSLIAGHGNPTVADNPADFAVKFSEGQWLPAAHLKLISKYLVKLERRQIRFLVVSCPPRHGKSLLIDVWTPLWWLTRNPRAHVIVAGYGEQFARMWGAAVRDKVLQWADKLNLTLSKDQNAADEWALKIGDQTGGGMVCTGVGGSLVGRGADLLIIDDPIKNAEEAYSLVYRDRMWEWFQAAAFTRLEPGGVCVVMCTRWHEDDLIGRILKNDEKHLWTEIRIPALAEEGDPLGRELGKPLWPERFDDDPDYSIRKASISPYWWEAQFQGRPSPEGGGLILRDWFRFYHTDNLMEFFKDADQWIQSWDPALSDRPTADYWVGQVWVRRGSNFYLVDMARGHYTLAKAQEVIRAWSLKYPKAYGKLMENSAMGPAIKQTMHHEIPGIIPVPAKGSKRSRIEAVTPFLMAGNVYLPENANGTKAKWVWEFVEECAGYPAAPHDDIPDAMAQSLIFMSPAGWRQLKDQQKKAEKPPDLLEERREWFNSFVKKELTKATKQFDPEHHRSRRLW